MQKRLYRSRTDKKIAGVCGGLGHYFNIDPSLIRVGYVLLSIFSVGFPALVVYIVACCVVPEEPLPQWQTPQPPQDEYIP